MTPELQGEVLTQALPERDYRGTLPPGLRGEVLAQNFITRCCPLRLERVLIKLEVLLAVAEVLKAKAAGVQ